MCQLEANVDLREKKFVYGFDLKKIACPVANSNTVEH